MHSHSNYPKLNKKNKKERKKKQFQTSWTNLWFLDFIFLHLLSFNCTVHIKVIYKGWAGVKWMTIKFNDITDRLLFILLHTLPSICIFLLHSYIAQNFKFHITCVEYLINYTASLFILSLFALKPETHSGNLNKFKTKSFFKIKFTRVFFPAF